MKKIILGLFLLFAVAGCNESITNDETNQDFNNYVLFYGFQADSSFATSVFVMDMRENSIKKIADSNYIYPTWYSYPQKILAFSTFNYNVELIDVENPDNNTVLVENIGNLLFMRYSLSHDAILFNYKQLDEWTGQFVYRIAYYDLKSNSLHNFPIINIDARNPVWSENDDFIYFLSKLDTTFSIMKVSKEGTSLEVVLQDSEFELSTFDISKNSEFLVASRYNQSKSYLTVYELKTKSILYNIDVTNLGRGLYPSFTSDNKKILFVNGIPYDYSTPRNIFIVDTNGDNLEQLTFADDYLYFRPLNW